MTHHSLLPHRYKKIGWFVLIPSLIVGFILLFEGENLDIINGKVPALIYDNGFIGGNKYFGNVDTELTFTIIGVFLIIGALIVGFSREAIEDEYIQEIRLSSLLWAVLVNYSLLLIAFLFIYGTTFLNVMVYNMFTILLLFIIRFHYKIYKSKKEIVR